MKGNLAEVIRIVSRITMSCLGTDFCIRAEHDNDLSMGCRIFLQVCYQSPCTKTHDMKDWHGRKWYLSQHMTEDEVIKTAYAAFEAAVKHEIMEGFKVDGIILFNPHVSCEELLKISHKEITRS